MAGSLRQADSQYRSGLWCAWKAVACLRTWRTSCLTTGAPCLNHQSDCHKV